MASSDLAAPGQRVGGQAERGQPLDRAHLRVGERLGQRTPGVGEEAQRARGGDRGVELAQRARRGVARVGEGPRAGRLLPGVERGEVLVGHVDLAAHLQEIGRAGEPIGDRAHRADVGGHVLADGAVAARGGAHQPAAFVADRQRQPVDLGLGGVGQRRVGGDAQEAAHAGVELGHLLGREHVGERQHPDLVPDFAEALGRRAAHALRGAIGPLQRGESRLQGRVAPSQRVVLGVAEDRRVLGVVGAVGRLDARGELGQLGPRGLLGQLLDRRRARPRVGARLDGQALGHGDSGVRVPPELGGARRAVQTRPRAGSATGPAGHSAFTSACDQATAAGPLRKGRGRPGSARRRGTSIRPAGGAARHGTTTRNGPICGDRQRSVICSRAVRGGAQDESRLPRRGGSRLGAWDRGAPERPASDPDR